MRVDSVLVVYLCARFRERGRRCGGTVYFGVPMSYVLWPYREAIIVLYMSTVSGEDFVSSDELCKLSSFTAPSQAGGPLIKLAQVPSSLKRMQGSESYTYSCSIRIFEYLVSIAREGCYRTSSVLCTAATTRQAG